MAKFNWFTIKKNIKRNQILMKYINYLKKNNLKEELIQNLYSLDYNIYEKKSSLWKIYFESITNNEISYEKGSGFFCKIEDNEITIKNGLFSNNHILNEKIIEKNKIIKIKYLNKIKEIKIIENRLYFTNNELGYTCIEILDSDEIKYFFEIDRTYFKGNKTLENEEIFILLYSNKEELTYSIGKIKLYKNNQLLIISNTDSWISCYQIIRKNNNLLFGLYIGGEKNYII